MVRTAWLLAGLLALHPPGPAGGQGGVAVLQLQGLRFGALLPGVAAVIPAAETQRSATLELLGAGHVTLTLSLPAGLSAGDGRLVPLRFGPGDVQVTFPRSSRVLTFDPTRPFSFHIPPGLGGATVRIGATALPGARQPPGGYRADITVQVDVGSTST